MSLSKFRAEIYKNASKIGINSLKPIQKNSILGILNNQNSVLLSEAGSGKSFSYILALCQSISLSSSHSTSNYLKNTSIDLLFTKPSTPSQDSEHGALILVPTEELSLQIYKYFRQIAP